MNVMEMAVRQARGTMLNDFGGPFGAAIVKDKEVIAVCSNSVLRDNDATAHAEINAIREASKKLNTYDLSGCVLYATGYPCPMCLSAIIWANIKEVYYGTDLSDAEAIGFRDDFIYNYINNKDDKVLSLKQIDRDICIDLFEEYKKMDKKIY